MQLVDYKYGSEQVSDTNQDRDKSPLKWNDPVRKVYFYEKQKPGVAWPGEDPPERLKALVCVIKYRATCMAYSLIS